MASLKKIAFSSLVTLSLIMNAAILFVGGVWLMGRLDPIVATPSEMRRVIKGLSWNSAGTWKVIEHDQKRILVQYWLPPSDIARYELPTTNFRLSNDLKDKKYPFALSFEGCDISSRVKNKDEFDCMKFRDLSPKECPTLPKP